MIAPLDWGLGHATRCIPLIKTLQNCGCKVTIAASGNVKTLLQAEFPQISFVHLNGYNIQYSTSKRFLALKILMQAPKIMLSIRRENTWLQQIITESGFDAVISDNRFGLYTNKIPCVFITHQLRIQAPYKWLQNTIQRINYRFINRYSQCWVPDFEQGNTIAGELSHPQRLPAVPVKYLGPLSRFNEMPAAPNQVKYAWMVILSGPEPQRTILENKLLSVIKNLKGNVLLVRGKPGSIETIEASENCTIANHLPTGQMLQALAASGFVISRCGYTTVMEMLMLGKKAVFIPTPGQTEQEYLATHLFKQGWCYTCTQDDDLLEHLHTAENFTYSLPVLAKTALGRVVKEFVVNAPGAEIMVK